MVAHALNPGEIPPAPKTIDLQLSSCDVKVDTQHYMSIHIIVANIARVLDRALSNVLQRPGTPEVILKPEWQSVIVKFACGPPPDWLWGEVYLLPDACVCFDSMSGKCVAGSSVVVVVSLSSCSFLLMVDEVIDNRKCHMPDHVTTWTLL